MTDRIVEIQRKGGVAHIKCLSGDTLLAPSPLFLERRLRPGDEIDPEAYRRFISQRGYPHALEAAMKFLALRERSRQEVVARLRRSHYDEATVGRVIDTLTAHGLLSDARFADAWADSRLKKYGKGRVAQELKRKGVDEEHIKKALDALPEEEAYQRALAQAEKLAKKFGGDGRRLIQALIRRGYGYSVAKKAAQEALDR